MLLTCPSCSMRYVVADASIGEDGRKVRCASCGHQWFQEGSRIAPDFTPEPVYEPVIQTPAEPDTPGDIPEGVKPESQNTSTPVLASDAQAMREKDLIARVCGFFCAFLVFLFLFLMLVLFKGTVVKNFPPSVMFYELIKLSPDLPGAGLVIDQLKVEEHDKELVIEGRIINLTSKEIVVPPVAAYILDATGNILATHEIAVEENSLQGEHDVDIRLVLSSPENATSVRVGFHFPE